MWLSVDPLAEKYMGFSPYNYVANNPLINIDPNGREIWIVIGRDESGTVTESYSIKIEYYLTRMGANIRVVVILLVSYNTL